MKNKRKFLSGSLFLSLILFFCFGFSHLSYAEVTGDPHTDVGVRFTGQTDSSESESSESSESDSSTTPVVDENKDERFPNTGEKKTTIFTIIGGVFLLLFAMIVIKIRKQKEESQ